MNLSPHMIREYMFPVYNRFAEEFGNVMLHYCCLPAPSGHVLPTLTECPGISCVDNWQGIRTFFDKNGTGMDQEKISICTDLSVENVLNVEKFMAEIPFYSSVKRKGGRGITATVFASTVDEGKYLYDTWQEYFRRKGML